MSNINAIHQHLQNTFPKSMTMPEFWNETNPDGSLRLFYYSTRGSFLAPLAVGLVREVARFQFDLDIVMTRIATQGVDGSRFTSWIVETRNPDDMHKLTTKVGGREGAENAPTHFTMPLKCPMTGIEIGNADEIPGMIVAHRCSSGDRSLASNDSGEIGAQPSHRTDRLLEIPGTPRTASNSCPFHNEMEFDRVSAVSTEHSRRGFTDQHIPVFGSTATSPPYANMEHGGLSAAAVRSIFPYHVLIDSDFCIRQVGSKLSTLLGTTVDILCGGYEIDEVFDFIKPKPAKWTRSWLRKLQDQEFVLECTLDSASTDVAFKGTWVPSIGPTGVDCMLVLCPDAKNLEDLRKMDLTLSDLPAHGAYRDAVFLREHLSRQMNNALQMEKLSKRLQTEKNLLESLLPEHAAEGLRRGQEVKPMIHNAVTMFFSDIVGFTSICRSLHPWQVIDMLNELYHIMDFLAGKFNLFKIETIGDAYVCAGGLPESDKNHAINVANFAVAVQHCSRRVLSPLDNKPIQLRVGIHSGEAASGIVGVTNPRYCVFGDTVNTTARHESTGMAGKVHCSRETMMELKVRSSTAFKLSHRGMIEMKGKGTVPTYWVEPTEENDWINAEGLKHLDNEVIKALLLRKVPKKSRSVKQQTSNSSVALTARKTLNEPIRTKCSSNDTFETVTVDESFSSSERSSETEKRPTLEILDKAIEVVENCNQGQSSDRQEDSRSRTHITRTRTPSREELIAMVTRSRKRRIEQAIKSTRDRALQIKQ
jgi:class 3 adenylate cyclase